MNTIPVDAFPDLFQLTKTNLTLMRPRLVAGSYPDSYHHLASRSKPIDRAARKKNRTHLLISHKNTSIEKRSPTHTLDASNTNHLPVGHQRTPESIERKNKDELTR
jgi:hypothetical protein